MSKKKQIVKKIANRSRTMGSKLPYTSPEDLLFAEVNKVWEIGYSTSYPYCTEKVPKDAMLILAPNKTIEKLYGDKAKVVFLTGLKEPKEIKPNDLLNWPTSGTKKVKDNRKCVRFTFTNFDEMNLAQFKRLFPIQYAQTMNSTGVYLKK